MSRVRTTAIAIACLAAGYALGRIDRGDREMQRSSPERGVRNEVPRPGASAESRGRASDPAAASTEGSAPAKPGAPAGLDSIDWSLQLKRARMLAEWEREGEGRNPEVHPELMAAIAAMMSDLAPAFRVLDAHDATTLLSHPAVQARLLCALVLEQTDSGSEPMRADARREMLDLAKDESLGTDLVARAEAAGQMYDRLKRITPPEARTTIDGAAASVLFAGHDEVRFPNAGLGATGWTPDALLQGWEHGNRVAIPQQQRAAAGRICGRWIARGQEAAKALQAEYGALADRAVETPPWRDADAGEQSLDARLALRLAMARIQRDHDAELAALLTGEDSARYAQRGRAPLFIAVGGS